MKHVVRQLPKLESETIKQIMSDAMDRAVNAAPNKEYGFDQFRIALNCLKELRKRGELTIGGR